MGNVSIIAAFAGVTLFLSSVLLSLRKRQRSTSEIPYFDYEGDKASKARFFNDAFGILTDAYRKLGDTTYKIRAPDCDWVLVSRSVGEELKSLPTSTLNFQAASNLLFAAKYLTIDATTAWSFDAIKIDLTQNLGKLMPELNDEMQHVLEAELPQNQEWTAVSVVPTMSRVVALLSGRLFAGPQLNRNEEWLHEIINFTSDIFEGVRLLKSWHPFLWPIVQYFIPTLRRIHKRRAKVSALLLPILKARAEAEAHAGYQKPKDMIQWVADRAKRANAVDLREHASAQLFLSVAAIFTSSTLLTHAVYDLAARPEYIELLRDEILRVHQEDGGAFTKQGLSRMRKLDSFLKEVQRLNPISLVNFMNRAIKPIVLKDGTTIPSGTILCVPNYVLEQNQGLWSNPGEFDGLRYYNLRQTVAKESFRHQLFECSTDSMSFGYGSHTCPGRFFATNELKLIMAYIIKHFDIELKEKSKGRPANLRIAVELRPDQTAQVMFKRIA